jgi:DMSO/TMAO reductase YedYZ molybdopterin-dependent catalytic subunit
MRRSPLLLGGFLGGITALPLIALFYSGSVILSLPFLPFDIFDWLARVMPGGLVTFVIDTMVMLIRGLNLGPTSEVAKLVQQAMALLMFIGGGIVMGAALGWILDRRASWPGAGAGLVAGILIGLIVTVIEYAHGFTGSPYTVLLWFLVPHVVWGALLGAWLDPRPPREPASASALRFREDRRTVLAKIVGVSAGLAALLWGSAGYVSDQTRETGADRPLPEPARIPPQPTTVAGLQPAPGTRPQPTPNDRFYRIDINLRPVLLHEDTWSLQVKGLFDRPRELNLADIQAMPVATQPITLSCISNPIGGDLIGTSYWTGVPLRDFLAELGLRPEAQALYVESADGFYETVVKADMEDPRTLLVYGMNGVTLPVDHGFPLRIYIPNRYGMKQPKWITSIEAVTEERLGYWVERGWSKEARPHTLAIIDTVAADNQVDGRVPVGGIAWAGDRGIQRVEVQVDDGPWQEAALLVPPLGPLTWVRWRYDWPHAAGRHTFQVRAVDGTGALQVAERSDAHPSGATGYHSVVRNM